ncbi:hypothetical protein [Flavivirga amylovorans]|uniref:hypothetical protein n=1 Tax=Flavivirga amylovorans TaxID=870486 RepID=UPI0026E038F4|nr:hypothetical protein [Flavivirga amylovorans]
MRPNWVYSGGPYISCPANYDYLLLNNPAPNPDLDLDTSVSTSDEFGCIRNSEGYTECPAPEENPNAQTEPGNPLPVIENPNVIAEALDLTNEQRLWLDQLENMNKKWEIGEFLLDYKYTVQYDNAQILARIAIGDWMIDPNYKIDLNESFLSPYKIDLSLITPTPWSPDADKTKIVCIYNKITKSPKFKSLFLDTFGDSENLNVRFRLVDNLASGANAETEANLQRHPVTQEVIGYTGLISINRANLVGRSAYSIARTIIHESLHAYLTVKQYKCGGTSLDILNDTEFGELINLYHSTACALQGDHEFMYDFLVPTISEILKEIRDDFVPANHQVSAESYTHFIDETNPSGSTVAWNWNDFYKYFSQMGLHKSDAFQFEVFPETSPKYQNFLKYNTVGNNDFSKDCN